MRSFLLALGLVWIAAVTYAQVPMTGAGLGKPAAGGGPVTVDFNSGGTSSCGNTNALGAFPWCESYRTATTGGISWTTTGMSVNTGNALVCVLLRVTSTGQDMAAGVALPWDSGGANQAMTSLKTITSGSPVFAYAGIFGLVSPTQGTGKTLLVTATNAGGTGTQGENSVGCVSFNGANGSSSVAFPAASANTATNANSVTCTSGTGHQVVGAMNNMNNGVTTMLGTTVFEDNANTSIYNVGADVISGSTPTVGSNVQSAQLVCVDVSP